MDFVIHWNETAMGLHVFPILFVTFCFVVLFCCFTIIFLIILHFLVFVLLFLCVALSSSSSSSSFPSVPGGLQCLGSKARGWAWALVVGVPSLSCWTNRKHQVPGPIIQSEVSQSSHLGTKTWPHSQLSAASTAGCFTWNIQQDRNIAPPIKKKKKMRWQKI